jgi:hypothetical protein
MSTRSRDPREPNDVEPIVVEAADARPVSPGTDVKQRMLAAAAYRDALLAATRAQAQAQLDDAPSIEDVAARRAARRKTES